MASASAAAESGSGTKFIYMSTAQVYASQTKKAAPVRMPTVCVPHHVLARVQRCLWLPTLACRTHARVRVRSRPGARLTSPSLPRASCVTEQEDSKLKPWTTPARFHLEAEEALRKISSLNLVIVRPALVRTLAAVLHVLYCTDRPGLRAAARSPPTVQNVRVSCAQIYGSGDHMAVMPFAVVASVYVAGPPRP